jgi:hypothetical protein
MTLSVETKVAALIAAGFVALSVGAIGQENRRNRPAEPNYRLTTETHLTQQTYNALSFSPTLRPRAAHKGGQR